MKRVELHIQELRVTLLVDTRENTTLDDHITTTRKHDTQIALELVKGCSEPICILLGNIAFYNRELRKPAYELGIRPIIGGRKFTPLHKAWNIRLDDKLYGQRNQSESVNPSIKRKYGSYITLRVWYEQFREVIVKCLIYNADRLIKK